MPERKKRKSASGGYRRKKGRTPGDKATISDKITLSKTLKRGLR